MHSKSNVAGKSKAGRNDVGNAPVFIDDATVAHLLRPADVIEVIAGAFVDPPIAPPRAVAETDEADGKRAVLAMPAVRRGGLATIKAVSAITGPSAALSSHLFAFDTRGALLAVVEAHRLTALRTAAVSVLAAGALGAGDRRHLTVLGAGRQARAHIEAYASTMTLDRVTVWARRSEAARELAEFAAEFAPSVRIGNSSEEAAEEADVVVCATPSREPIVSGDRIAAGAHVDLVGGFRPDMREADDALMARAAIVTDTSAALSEAGDLVQPIASGAIAPDDVLLLHDVLAGRVTVPIREVTVFKSVGHAAADLVVAELLLARLGLPPACSRESAGEDRRELSGVAANE
jgi:ornithine cyclodeaminase